MPLVYTIGHSTRPVAEFIAILEHVGIGLVADIRTVPKSRHNPQFHIDRLAGSLAGGGGGVTPRGARGGGGETGAENLRKRGGPPRHRRGGRAGPGAVSGSGRLPGLGGLRKPARDSINTGWRNASFRGYADYMQTRSFEEAIEELIALTAEHVTVIMCAEAVFWRCHRRLVADALLVRGIDVQHIMGASTLTPAAMTSFASVRGTRVTYPSTPR
ncbi:DUF488 domain-containing protein [Nocardia cyriacigeorgica]|uniref:DUF488 domain-containing protein n=1 Tax=Nocardia cyriacigeorgica TaxID=135487 RepID=UPI0024585BFE|nr:DUF488 domain-containing protein [Nocardia cyriacigeorgica]